MTRGKFSLLAVVFMTAVFLASCGEHSFDDMFGDIFGVSSSSVEASDNSSSSGTLETNAIYVPETRMQNIAEYQVEVKIYTFNTDNGKAMNIGYSFPKTNEGNAKILFALHGSGGTAEGMMSSFKYLSETENIIVIAPEFLSEQFPWSQFPNLDIASNINKPENWMTKIIDEIFLDFKERFELSNDKYILYGSSLGGIFTQRMAMFSESPYMEYSISSLSGGQLTSPDDENYPSGIKNLLMHKDLIDRNFGRKMYLLLGNRDTSTANGYTGIQGSNRYTRALYFYTTSKDYCERNDLFFNIDLMIMDGMGHSGSPQRPYVIDIVKGIYDSKKENAQ
jgi:predicted esterase